MHHPLLQLDELHVQAPQLLLVLLGAKRLVLGRLCDLFYLGFLLVTHDVLLLSQTGGERPSPLTVTP
ncbi:hypothetical protein D3C80_1439170 [compost metagenome]